MIRGELDSEVKACTNLTQVFLIQSGEQHSAAFVYLKYNPCDTLHTHVSCLKYGPQMKGINTFQNSFVPLTFSFSFCLHIATYSRTPYNP